MFKSTIACVTALAMLMSSVSGCVGIAQPLTTAGGLGFSARTGGYLVTFRTSAAKIVLSRAGTTASLSLVELSGPKNLNLLAFTKSVRRKGNAWMLAGTAPWADFKAEVALLPAVPGLIHVAVSVKLRKNPPSIGLLPDVHQEHAADSSLKLWAPAPPAAGTSLFLSSKSMNTTILYLADLTALGPYFERTRSGGSQSVFAYPRAGTDGALVGMRGQSFGYVPPPTSLGDLPHGKWTPVISSYLYLLAGVPSDEAAMAQTYLTLLSGVYNVLPKVALRPADWPTLAEKAAVDLQKPANWVTVDGVQYLRSYVSDTRSSPELITQAGILAGLKAYERRSHTVFPITATLEHNLSSFYDPTFQTVKNGLGRGGDPREESWYYVGNLISLLQASQNGSDVARRLLMDSIDGAISLAHTNQYEFPQSFSFKTWDGHGTGLQSDVAGGYAWLMLGMYDLTKASQYLDEAMASIKHIAGKGFDLTYETQMTGYAAGAAERLYSVTHDPVYRHYANLALANLFHVTRLWDCTYGLCRKGTGYHTYFGVNILPWGNYIAMLEQYGAWLGIRDYMTYASDEPVSLRALIQGFLSNTPAMMQYALPPQLPSGVVPNVAGLYDFVPRNDLSASIPVEDLRTGEQQSGTIGQEVYGAGGIFMFAAYAP